MIATAAAAAVAIVLLAVADTAVTVTVTLLATAAVAAAAAGEWYGGVSWASVGGDEPASMVTAGKAAGATGTDGTFASAGAVSWSPSR